MSAPDRPSQPLVLSLAALTVGSGGVDAVSYPGLGHVFMANMTGNPFNLRLGLTTGQKRPRTPGP